MSNWGIARLGVYSTTPGTPVSVTANNNAAGAWVEVESSAPAGVAEVQVIRTGASGLQCALDVGIGESGSQVVVADRCVLPPSAGELISSIRLPIAIPAGQRVWVRLHGLGSSATLGVIVQFGRNGGLWPIASSRIAVHGLDASYVGTTVTSATTQHQFGAAVEVVASLAHAARGIGLTFVGAGNGVVHRGTARVVDASGVVLSPLFAASATAAGNNSALPGLYFAPCQIPAGANLRVQMANNNSASETQRAFVLYTVH